ncbi:MAG TPA: hypothetical protein VLZ05_25295 [Mycobacterium sp.]|nr:hypothetical protein [Mycobacterium sp.]HUH71893.1 hypothetical protein [Mycobacterium sp.]
MVQIRQIREWLALCAAIALIPWTIYLGLTLPQSYTAQHWQATWVGFDVLLLAFMIATAVLGFTHHHLLTLFAFTTGVLLVCDAWFDVLTAKRGDFAVSVLTAGLGELPLAAVLIIGALRIARLQVPPLSRAWWPFPRRRRGNGVRRASRVFHHRDFYGGALRRGKA